MRGKESDLGTIISKTGSAFSGPPLCEYCVLEGKTGAAEVEISAERSLGEQLRYIHIAPADSIVIDCRDLDYLQVRVTKNDYDLGTKFGEFSLIWKVHSRPSSEYRYHYFLPAGVEDDIPAGAKWVIFGAAVDVSFKDHLHSRTVTFTAIPGELYRVPGGRVTASDYVNVCWLLDPI